MRMYVNNLLICPFSQLKHAGVCFPALTCQAVHLKVDPPGRTLALFFVCRHAFAEISAGRSWRNPLIFIVFFHCHSPDKRVAASEMCVTPSVTPQPASSSVVSNEKHLKDITADVGHRFLQVFTNMTPISISASQFIYQDVPKTFSFYSDVCSIITVLFPKVI